MTTFSKLLANPTVLQRRNSGRVVALAAAVGLVASSVHAQPVKTAERDAALRGFTERADAYVELRKKLEKGLPALKEGAVSTGGADTHQSLLAKRVREARADAKQGDIFGDATPYFREMLKEDVKTRSGADEKALREEVPTKSAPAVNAEYPEQAALATVPPLLLVNLPRLPDGLEYRFMGRQLVIRDRSANLVVDFIPGAMPAPRR